MNALLWGILGYLLGAIPFGLLLTRAAGLGDVRNIGSGNIGATNVLRTGNKTLALATLVLDGAKGAVAVLIAKYTAGFDSALIAGFAALLGHIFPVWLKFKGGKGVATSLAVLLALAPQIGLLACALWLLVAASTCYSSLSALVAVAAAPFIAWGFGFAPPVSAVCAFMASLVWFKHRENIKRLINGTEPKIGALRT